jgi:uncharacterized protein
MLNQLNSWGTHPPPSKELAVSSPVVWFEVIGQDGDKLRRFYGEVLGWKFRRGPHPSDRRMGLVESGRGIAARVGEGGLGHPSWLTFYAEVADLEAALSRARALGSRVLMAPTPVPEATIAVVSDPEGHPVGLWSRRGGEE